MVGFVNTKEGVVVTETITCEYNHCIECPSSYEITGGLFCGKKGRVITKGDIPEWCPLKRGG